LGKITKDGIYIETLEKDPAKFLPEVDESKLSGEVVKVNLN
jgi:fumarate hydratase class I